MSGPFEISMPLLESFNDGKELLIVDIIVELCVDHKLDVEGNGLRLLAI